MHWTPKLALNYQLHCEIVCEMKGRNDCKKLFSAAAKMAEIEWWLKY